MSARDLDTILESARARTSSWDAERSNRVLASAITRRASIGRRNTILRRGVAVGAGAMLLAFAVHALALTPSSSASASQWSAPGAQQSASGGDPTPCQKDCELATRQTDGGYGTD
jgi:hypothetical protein